jgi:hypothetical protein
MIKVLVNPAVPAMQPMIVLLDPVVTLEPAALPMNVLLQAKVFC